MSCTESLRPCHLSGTGTGCASPESGDEGRSALTGGPVETAWVTALATPRERHVAFVATVAPGIAVRPFTLFVNKAAITGERHAALTWGAAHAGVAAGVMEAVAEGTIAEGAVPELLLVVAAWVNPEASDESAVFANNKEATLGRFGRAEPATRRWPTPWPPGATCTTRTSVPEHYGGPVPRTRLHQMNLIVGDVRASRAFYGRLGLDFGEVDDPVWSDHHVSAVPGAEVPIDVDLDSQSFAVKWNQGWPGGPGLVLGFRVGTRQEVDELVAELAADGVPVQQEPFDAFWGARYAVVSDPDGNGVGIMSPSDPAFRSEAPRPQ